MFKRIHHLLCKAPDWAKNIMFGLGVISVMALMFVVSTGVFWLKIQAANFMFG